MSYTTMAAKAAATAGASSSPPSHKETRTITPAKDKETEHKTQEDDLEEEQEITHTPYVPKSWSMAGRPHPDPVVEISSLGSVEPPDVTYSKFCSPIALYKHEHC